MTQWGPDITGPVSGPETASPAGGWGTVTPPGRAAPRLGAASGGAASAEAIIKQFLDKYGLGSLGSWAWHLYTTNGGGQTGMDAIQAELPSTKEFKTRFPAYDILAKQGRAMSPAEMLNYEQTARQIFHANGLPDGFYDTPQGLAQFMVNDVSTTELEARVKDAQQAMISSPQDVRDQLQRFYGIDQGHLTAFFLDPKVAEPLIAQKFTAAQIAAQAQRTQYGQLNEGQAMGLAQLGVTDQTAAQGFNKLGMEHGLFEQQVAGETSIGADQQIAAQFGGNVGAQQAFLERRQQRVSQFQEDSAFKAGAKGIGGLGASDQSVPA